MKVVAIFLLCFCCGEVISENKKNDQLTDINFNLVGRQLVEQGRTLVHHAVKRFMIILPAIFFKLGIAFTLLILVTLVAVNNGFIGFLLLVVGMSSLLARLQEARRPGSLPVPVPVLSPFSALHQQWDRSDLKVNNQDSNGGSTLAYNAYVQPQQYAYYAKYPTNQ